MHRGISDEHRAPAAQQERQPEDFLVHRRRDDPGDLLQGHVVVAGQAGDHGVGVAHRNHAGGEDVAFAVDQTLAIAEQHAVALQLGIQEVHVLAGRFRELGVVDLDAVAGRQAEGFHFLTHHFLASDQNRRAVAGGAEGDGGADGLFLLALGENHPLGGFADLLEDGLQAGHGRIETGRQLVAVGRPVLDRLAGDAGFHGRPGHRLGNGDDQARIERRRDDVLGAVAQLRGVGGVDLVGNVLAREGGEGPGSGQLHFVVDGAGANVEGAPEDVREAEHVVDLVRIIGTSGGHDGVGPHLLDRLGRDLGIRVGHGEDDRIVGHGLDHVLAHRVFDRQAHEHVGAGHGLGQGARLGLDGVRRLPLVHAVGAALVDDAPGVAHDDVLGLEAEALHQFDAGDGRGAGAVDHQLAVLDPAPGEVTRIDQAGGRDDGGAVLVVVEDGDVHDLAQALLDDEALGRLDVFQVDTAEARGQEAHAVYQLFGVLGVDAEVDAVDVGEALEQDRLAFHHRLGAERAQVAQAEDGGAVADHGDQVALGGVVVGERRILGDFQARRGDARRIRQGQIALRGQRFCRLQGDFAGTPGSVHPQGFGVHFGVGVIIHNFVSRRFLVGGGVCAKCGI